LKVWEYVPTLRRPESKPPGGGQVANEASHWVTVWTPPDTCQATVDPAATVVSHTEFSKEAEQK
jgi:hypothetical protein